MNSKTSKFLFLFFISISLMGYAADGNKKDSKSLNKTQGSPTRSKMNINSVSTFFENDSNSDLSPDGNSGLVFPKGSGKTAVFESGLIWGAKIAGDPQVRVGGNTHRQGMQPGKIISLGLAESVDLPKNRIYRVRPDVYPGGPTVDISGEAADEGLSEAAIREQYEKDWTEWPVADGAEYFDANGNGKYDLTPNSDPALRDIPGVKGANQTIWFVCNDLDPSKTQNMYGTLPLGIELQGTVWAYAQTGALGNMFFRKYKLINKSSTTFDSMYVSMWSDVDLGFATDDYAGCDTLLSLGYVYNANATDDTYKPLPPPAVGFDFFQGPLLTGVAGEDKNKNGVDDAEDYGIFAGKKVGPGKINLPMTAFYYFARGDASVTDPVQSTAGGATSYYNFFQGKIGLTGAPFVDPNTLQQTTYALSGDPQTRSGWVDGQLVPPDDRRIGSSSGPFQMAVGDTQEVVVAQILAGAIEGTDRLSAIGLLKFYDQVAQLAYDNFFDLPTAPPAPEVSVVELEKEIVLDWGFDNSKVTATESSDSKGYKFQGYNVYQLPSSSADVSAGKRIATFDVVDGVGKIADFFFDANTGVVAKGVRQFGNDTGIKRYLNIKNDELLGGTPLINGIRYYYAVTSYSYNPDPLAVPNNLENPLKILTIIPSSTMPGVRYEVVHGDTLEAVNSGTSDGAVLPIVIDPTKLTGHTYKVNFGTENVDDGEGNLVPTTYWKLTDATLNKVLLDKQFNQTGDEEYQFVDGMQIKVTGPPPGMKEWLITGTRRFSPVNGFTGLGLEGFSDAGNPTAYNTETGTIGMAGHFAFGGIGTTLNTSQYHKVVLKLAAVDPTVKWDPLTAPADPNFSKGYRWLRNVASGVPADPSFAPWIINPEAGYPYQDYNYGVPFSAWDMTTNPPTRLMVGHFENNVVGGLLDGRYWPYHASEATTNSTAREFAFIFSKPYSETPDPAFQSNISNNATLPLMWVMVCSRRNANPWAAGDEFTIVANVVNTIADEFTFTAPAPSSDLTTAQQDIEKVNVFPNPYYGVNSEEINKYNRFVTFSHLPVKATIRIFNLAGVLVKEIDKNSTDQFERWDLANNSGLPVASGLYIAYIDMPDIGKTKVLKVAIIQEQQILDRY
jgi:hypothetical protein